jgi:hypothetical protein
VSVDTKTWVAAALPHVNLLPPEIREVKRLHQIQLGAIAALAVSAVVVGALYTTGASDVTKAKQQVVSATADNATLTTKVASFSNVRQIESTRDAHEAMLTQAMSSEIQWSTYFGAFATLPTSSWLKSMTLSETVAPGSLTSPSQAPAVVATAAFSGVGMNYSSLAAWLDRVTTLGQDNGLSNTYFNSATEAFVGATKIVNFTGTANLSSAALSGRCAKSGTC